MTVSLLNLQVSPEPDPSSAYMSQVYLSLPALLPPEPCLQTFRYSAFRLHGQSLLSDEPLPLSDALFPVQKLSAAASCRLSVPFVCFAERRQCGVSSADVLHPHLADGCIRFSVAHVPQFLRCHNRLEHPLLVLIGTCLFSQRNRAFLPTVHPSGRLPGH